MDEGSSIGRWGIVTLSIGKLKSAVNKKMRAYPLEYALAWYFYVVSGIKYLNSSGNSTSEKSNFFAVYVSSSYCSAVIAFR